MNREEFILRDLLSHEYQSSWDWPADLRFAEEFFPDSADCIRMAIKSSAPAPLRIAAFESTSKKVKDARLRALRSLVKKGKVKASWVGTGWGGKHEFGLSRIRSYSLQ